VSHRPVAHRTLVATALLAIFVSPVAATAQSNAAPSGAAAAQPVTKSALSSQLDASFKRLDSNSDKSLTTAEIDAAQKRQMAEAQNSIAKRLEAEFAKLDGNKDGQLSLAEFKAAAPTPKVAPPAELLGQLDKNKDGKVTQDEFRSVPLANFDRIDTNKDGTISDAEKSALTRQQR
jgi:hypothetical protein